MVPSAFNVRVPLASGDVFLMNTLTDAQAVVSGEVTALLDDLASGRPRVPEAQAAAAAELAEHGFLVADRDGERAALEARFAAFRDDVSEVRVTVLTTLRCNFACEYCYQGDHGGPGSPAGHMTPEAARRTAAWIVREIERVRPARLVLTFFGGEPLLNPEATVDIAARCHNAAARLGIEVAVAVVTNGLLLTPEIVGRLLPLGLRAVKVTLDGDRDAHDRARPMRGGQPTFDRIIENIRRVAPLVPVAIGGNFDASSAERYPALLAFLREQDFAGRISQVSFKPVVTPAATARRIIPLTPADAPAARCGAGPGGGSVCDSCHVADDQMAWLMGETRRHGFETIDGVHMGPCDLYRAHSHTIGPDGTLYACPGFTGEHARPVGHIDRAPGAAALAAAARVHALAPWRHCGDCAFVPVCGGGCAVAAHAELGDMSAPSCHKPVFEAALHTLAADAAASL